MVLVVSKIKSLSTVPEYILGIVQFGQDGCATDLMAVPPSYVIIS